MILWLGNEAFMAGMFVLAVVVGLVMVIKEMVQWAWNKLRSK